MAKRSEWIGCQQESALRRTSFAREGVATNLVPAKLPAVHGMNANDVSIVSPLSALHLWRRKGVEALGANST
jgi:hypothetical protein